MAYRAEQGDLDDPLAEIPDLNTVWLKIGDICYSLDPTTARALL